MVAQMMLDPFRRPGDVDHSPIMLPVTGGMITATILGAASGANFSEPVNTVAGFLCIGAIVGLSTMRTANVGCKLGMAGVGGAVSTTLMNVSPGYTILVLSMLGLGGAAGYNVQSLVYPIQLPQTDDSVSLAGGGGRRCLQVLDRICHILRSDMHCIIQPRFWETLVEGRRLRVLVLETIVQCVILGYCPKPNLLVSLYRIHDFSITFRSLIWTPLPHFLNSNPGSLVAFGKLNGRMDSKPLSLPGKNLLNLVVSVLSFFLWPISVSHLAVSPICGPLICCRMPWDTTWSGVLAVLICLFVSPFYTVTRGGRWLRKDFC